MRGYVESGLLPNDRASAERDEALRQIGTNAVPFLLSWIQYETPPWKYRVYHLVNPILARLGISKGLDDRKLEYQAVGAVWAFKALGDKADYALGDLEKLFNDPAHQLAARRAAMVLVRRGIPTPVPLLMAVTNQQVNVSTLSFLIAMLTISARTYGKGRCSANLRPPFRRAELGVGRSRGAMLRAPERRAWLCTSA